MLQCLDLDPRRKHGRKCGQCERAVGVITSSICAGNSLVWCLCVAVSTEKTASVLFSHYARGTREGKCIRPGPKTSAQVLQVQCRWNLGDELQHSNLQTPPSPTWEDIGT